MNYFTNKLTWSLQTIQCIGNHNTLMTTNKYKYCNKIVLTNNGY